MKYIENLNYSQSDIFVCICTHTYTYKRRFSHGYKSFVQAATALLTAANQKIRIHSLTYTHTQHTKNHKQYQKERQKEQKQQQQQQPQEPIPNLISYQG